MVQGRLAKIYFETSKQVKKEQTKILHVQGSHTDNPNNVIIEASLSHPTLIKTNVPTR